MVFNTSRFDGLVVDWTVENVAPYMTLYGMSYFGW